MMRVLLIVLLCSTLVACGYHLSGTQQGEAKIFSTALKKISVEGLGRYDSLRQHLISALRSYGFQVIQRSGASARIIIDDKRVRETVAVIGEDVKAQEYLMTMTVRFNVKQTVQPVSILLQNQTVQAEAFYRHNPVELLENANLRRNAESRLEEEIVRKIMSRLTTIH